MANIIENDKYQDPSNIEEIIERLKKCESITNVRDLAHEIYPDWFIAILDSYCEDYPHLTRNWLKICEISNTKPVSIIIVDELFFDNSHSLIKAFAECFTRCGFIVRRKSEFIPCSICSKAIPTIKMYNLFKEKNISAPDSWSSMCLGCE